jgi:cytochrome oxidase assembly protein ShyY1
MVKVFITILITIMVLTLMVGAWQVERRWNYTISYRQMVEETVRDMVKQESLK